jgi:hypothetical protein
MSDVWNFVSTLDRCDSIPVFFLQMAHINFQGYSLLSKDKSQTQVTFTVCVCPVVCVWENRIRWKGGAQLSIHGRWSWVCHSISSHVVESGRKWNVHTHRQRERERWERHGDRSESINIPRTERLVWRGSFIDLRLHPSSSLKRTKCHSTSVQRMLGSDRIKQGEE